MNLDGRSIVALLPLLLAIAAKAQIVPDGPSALAVGPSPICTDRPTKTNFACTVPAGTVQVESDLFNWSRATIDNTRIDVLLYTNPTVKYGVGAATDIELSWVPDERIRIRTGGLIAAQSGVGDIYLRLKQELTGSSDAVQISLLPYIKAPTAPHGIGNRAWEGGLIIPVNVTLPEGFTLTVDPEADVVTDGNGGGHHGQVVGLVNLGKQLTPSTTLYGELWTSRNYDPAGRIDQVSADFAVARLIGKNVQADFGGNFGLDRDTPSVQFYAGISFRFR